ncbi:hypothetical protein C8R44DRAFT_812321 [Mycena epipterygia]|nr:hypothetical protein C8R44DRAFT_812321 [Mycena epipterygia]
MEAPRSQLAQELIDNIIGLLDSSGHWRACALVSRSWVYTAQSYIFRRVSLDSPVLFDNERLWARFLAALDKSPHLLRHVHELCVHHFGDQLATETFDGVCNFPFTHLDVASVAVDVDSASALALQQLLSLPTLRRVRLNCSIASPSAFLGIWTRCSAGLRHLELDCGEEYNTVFLPTPTIPSPIRLESLRIMVGPGVSAWLTHSLCPVDFSALKLLSIYRSTELLSMENAPALQTMETLQFEIYPSKPTLALSAFPHLRRLRISINFGEALSMSKPLAPLKVQVAEQKWTWMLATLSTISPSNSISKIEIVSSFNFVTPSHFEQLDALLSGLPIQAPPIVELQTGPDRYDEIKPHFPQLSAKNTLRQADYTSHFLTSGTQ